MNEIEILRDLIKFNTIKDKENKEMLEYIEKFLKNLGFKTNYKDKCLIMSIKEDYKLGFLGHTDTVEYIKGWNTDPFILTEKEGKLYGLGASDMKGGIAAILKAVSEVDFNKLRYGMKLYFTYDEEIGFAGIQDIISRNERFPNFMIIGEPTDNEILTGSKGLIEYEIEFEGKKVHSSNPKKGKNAILACINFINELQYFYEENIKTEINNQFEIPYTTMNIGTINGGSAINSVPAECKIKMDFRTIKKAHSELIKSKIEELSRKYKAKINIYQNINPFINKVFEISEEIKTSNYITEASFIDSSVSKIILGPGPMTGHEVNEYIEIKSFRKTVQIYKDIIMKYLK